MAELNVERRDSRGKLNARRLRRAGAIPAVLYGHGQETIALSIPAEALDVAVRHGARLLNLTGAVKEQAFLREVQWNTWGTQILHVDFSRISEHEKVQVQVSVELRGEAPGVREGGVVVQHVHEVEIECEVASIPEKLFVNVNHLKLGDQVAIKDLDLPPTARVLGDQEVIVVECTEPAVEEEEAAAPAEGTAEPELIGRKPESEEEAAE
jgi:large subunit ribosomal protein L25